MTAIEYIQLSPYSKYKGTIPVINTGFNPFMLNGEVYCTGTMDINNMSYSFIRVNLDGRILQGLPNSVNNIIEYRKQIYNLWKRIDDFFNTVIDTAEASRPNTELVKLRIIVNLIYNLPIPQNDRHEWASWIKELYWSRKVYLNKWYIEYILPF